MELTGGGEGVERFADFAPADQFVRVNIDICAEPVVDGELWRVGLVLGSEVCPHSAGVNRAVLGGVADEAHGCPGLVCHGEDGVELAVSERSGFVDDEHGSGVKSVEAPVVVVGEVRGDRVGADVGLGSEVAGSFAFDGCA